MDLATRDCYRCSFCSIKKNNGDPVMWGMKLKNADMVCFKTRQSQVICGTQSPHLEDDCAYLRRTRLSQFHECARCNLQVVTTVPTLKSFRLMQVYEWTVCQRFNLGHLCWRRSSVNPPRATLSIKDATLPFTLIHILSHLFLNQLIMFRASFPTVNSTFLKTSQH